MYTSSDSMCVLSLAGRIGTYPVKTGLFLKVQKALARQHVLGIVAEAKAEEEEEKEEDNDREDAWPCASWPGILPAPTDDESIFQSTGKVFWLLFAPLRNSCESFCQVSLNWWSGLVV